MEQDLAAGFGLLDRAERKGRLGVGESGALATGVVQCMNGALAKLSESLEAQSLLRRELDQAREDFRNAQADQTKRVQALETEVVALRQALDSERDHIRLELARFSVGELPQGPADEYLHCPLVLCSPQGDYLGVTDAAGQALSLSGFLRLVETGERGCAPSGRIVATCWQNFADQWCLTISISGAQVRKCYMLETCAVRTPSGNNVTLLAEIRVDGVSVPQDFVVQMFRQLRDSFQEE